MWLFVPDAITLFAHSSTIACASAWLWSAIEYVAALNRVNSKGTCADDFVHFELFHAEDGGCVDFLFHFLVVIMF